MHLNHKRMVMASPRLEDAMIELSKTTLADIIVDRIKAEVGESASDEEIIEVLQKWLSPVIRAREDKPVELAKFLVRYDERRKKLEAQRAAE